jgi:hypothetical protein
MPKFNHKIRKLKFLVAGIFHNISSTEHLPAGGIVQDDASLQKLHKKSGFFVKDVVRGSNSGEDSVYRGGYVLIGGHFGSSLS